MFAGCAPCRDGTRAPAATLPALVMSMATRGTARATVLAATLLLLRRRLMTGPAQGPRPPELPVAPQAVVVAPPAVVTLFNGPLHVTVKLGVPPAWPLPQLAVNTGIPSRPACVRRRQGPPLRPQMNPGRTPWPGVVPLRHPLDVLGSRTFLSQLHAGWQATMVGTT